jgi:hypothetical protein
MHSFILRMHTHQCWCAAAFRADCTCLTMSASTPAQSCKQCSMHLEVQPGNCIRSCCTSAMLSCLPRREHKCEQVHACMHIQSATTHSFDQFVSSSLRLLLPFCCCFCRALRRGPSQVTTPECGTGQLHCMPCLSCTMAST